MGLVMVNARKDSRDTVVPGKHVPMLAVVVSRDIVARFSDRLRVFLLFCQTLQHFTLCPKLVQAES